jgi:hypothetical protein
MTQEDIIRMAREAGFEVGEREHGQSVFNPYTVDECCINAELERFFRLAYEAGAAAERAACADICDQHASIEGIAQRCAAEIRARGNK